MANPELDQLKAANGERIAELNRNGINLGGLEHHQLRAMLEELLGDRLEAAHLRYERWVAEQLPIWEKAGREAKTRALFQGPTPGGVR